MFVDGWCCSRGTLKHGRRTITVTGQTPNATHVSWCSQSAPSVPAHPQTCPGNLSRKCRRTPRTVRCTSRRKTATRVLDRWGRWREKQRAKPPQAAAAGRRRRRRRQRGSTGAKRSSRSWTTSPSPPSRARSNPPPPQVIITRPHSCFLSIPSCVPDH